MFEQFLAAFRKLDGQCGLPRVATTLDLRNELSTWSRLEFDSMVMQLRKSGYISCSLFDGRYKDTDLLNSCVTIDDIPYSLIIRRKF